MEVNRDRWAKIEVEAHAPRKASTGPYCIEAVVSWDGDRLIGAGIWGITRVGIAQAWKRGRVVAFTAVSCEGQDFVPETLGINDSGVSEKGLEGLL